jgi:hypothetical protein
VRLATSGSLDTVLTVFGECGAGEIACDDDGGPGVLSELTFAATAGEDYFIRVAGFNGVSGSFVLNITRLDTCFVGGQCFVAGDGNPDGGDPDAVCQVCVPQLDPLSFSPRPEGTACGNPVADDPQCDSPDACNGEGACEANHKPAGFACGDPTATDCNEPDTCDGLGACVVNLEPAGTPCGDSADTECDNPDTCDGAGLCLNNFEPAATPCGDPSSTPCDAADGCSGTGACQDNIQPNGTPCPDPVFCNGAETCQAGLCAEGAPPCIDPAHCDEGADMCLECLSAFECGDQNFDGVSDDQCFWYQCSANVCSSIARPFGDLGGAFGACPPDQVADNNDRFHALNCFADQTTAGTPGYPCEANPPTAINVDAGGEFGDCCPDGVCDANDAFHALNAFQGTTTCSCPDACPSGPQPDAEPLVVGQTSISLVAQRQEVAPQGLVQVEIFIDDALQDLRGYQMHIGVRGGTAGSLRLVDMTIEERPSWVFAGLPAWRAFNLNTQQMLAGLSSPGVSTRANGYLATLTLQAGADASGTFLVDILHDDAAGLHRTFLFATPTAGKIAITKTRAAAITVLQEGGAKTSRR